MPCHNDLPPRHYLEGRLWRLQELQFHWSQWNISTWFQILNHYSTPMLVWLKSYPVCQCHTSSEPAVTEVAFSHKHVRMKILLVSHMCLSQRWNPAGFQQHSGCWTGHGEAKHCNTKTCLFGNIPNGKLIKCQNDWLNMWTNWAMIWIHIGLK